MKYDKLGFGVLSILLIVALKGTGASLGGIYVPDPDTVALYHLNDGQGTSAEDSTGNGYDGILFGTNTWASIAKYGGGLRNESNSGGFNVNISFPGKNFTVEGWFKPDSFDETKYLFWGTGSSAENIFYVRQQVVSGTPRLVCGIYDCGTSTWHEIYGGSMALDAWYHMALTISNSGYANDTTNNIIKMCLYQNGSLITSGIYDFATLPEAVVDLRVGYRFGTGNNFTGIMDEIRISQTPRYSFTLPLNSQWNLINIGTYFFDDIYLDIDMTTTGLCEEIWEAGFNFLVVFNTHSTNIAACASTGLKTSVYPVTHQMYLPEGSNPTGLISVIDDLEDDPTVRLWCAIDEPNIHDLSPTGVANAYDTVIAHDNYFTSVPHKVWLNYAPRGRCNDPYNAQDFTLLRDYNSGADIIAMDVYPVPEFCGFSNLPNQTASCIGDYVDILYNQVANWESDSIQYNHQVKPIWMVLPGYGKDDSRNGSYNSHGIDLQWYDDEQNYLGTFRLNAIDNDVWCYEFAQSVSPPAGATKVYVLLRAYSAGNYYFDNIDFREVGGVNMLLNPTAETANGSMPADWGTAYSVPRGSVTFTWDTSKYISSSHSMKIAMAGSAYYYHQADWRQGPFAVSPEKTYSLGGYIYSERRPLWEQTRFMAYNAIIHGARGIVYYGHEFIPITSKLWQDMKDLATELYGLSSVLASNRSFRNVTVSNGAIETLLLETDGKLYLLAANRYPSTIHNATITISGLPLSSITRIYETGSIAMGANSFTDNFTGYQVHVYQIQRQE